MFLFYFFDLYQLLVWEKKLKQNGVRIDAAFVELQLDTRFTQMQHAADMELWTEAWRTIQDVHDIMASTPRELKPKVRADFYLQLSNIFLQAGSSLFHAHALAKYVTSRFFTCRGVGVGVGWRWLRWIVVTLVFVPSRKTSCWRSRTRRQTW